MQTANISVATPGLIVDVNMSEVTVRQAVKALATRIRADGSGGYQASETIQNLIASKGKPVLRRVASALYNPATRAERVEAQRVARTSQSATSARRGKSTGTPTSAVRVSRTSP